MIDAPSVQGGASAGAGLVLAYDKDGVVLQVLVDRMGTRLPVAEGVALSTLVAPGSEEKLEGFLGEVTLAGAAFDWEVNLGPAEDIQAASLFGTMRDGLLTVIAAANRGDLMRLMGEFFAMNNELVTTVRQLSKRLAEAERKNQDVVAVGDLMQLNNELITLQRDLAKKNVEIERSNRLVRSILDTAPDVIYIYDLRQRRMTYVSKGVVQVLGYQPSEWLALGEGELEARLAPGELGRLAHNAAELSNADEGKVVEWEGPITDADGEQRWARCRASVFERGSDGAVASILVVLTDITRQHSVEERLREMATADELTGLLNRRGLESLIGSAVAQAARTGVPVAVLVADIDGLKSVNDDLGHIEGDRVIRETGEVLRVVAREADLVARVGGDEFVIFTVGTDDSGMQRLTDRIREAFDRDVRHAESGRVGLSMGHAVERAESDDVFGRLFKSADELMYRNKRHRKSGARR